MKRDFVSLLCDIGELTDVFTDAPSLEAFLDKIVSMVAAHMQARVCSVYLYHEDTEELVLTATHGLKKEAVNAVRLKCGEGLTGLALKEMRTVCEPDASRNPQYRYFCDIGEEAFQSFLAVPILRGHRRIGVMVMQNDKKDYFAESDMQAVRAITSQLAHTIEAAKMLMSFSEKRKVPQHEEVVSLPSGIIKGRAGSSGSVYARAAVYARRALFDVVSNDPRSRSAVASAMNVDAFRAIVRATEKRLKAKQTEIEETLCDVASLIFTVQILLLKDGSFVGAMEERFRAGSSAQSAIVDTVKQYISKFDALDDPYFREKKYDVMDVGLALLETLLGEQDSSVSYASLIVVAQELFPSDVLKLSAQGVKGIVLLSGGITSHVAILSRSLGMPLVIAEVPALLHMPQETMVLVDGDQGNLYVDPSEAVIETFRQKERAQEEARRVAEHLPDEARTTDGTHIAVMANINLLSDVRTALDCRCEGIGLYRTEFPFIVRSTFPTEEEQYIIYKKLVEGAGDKEITFRTLDIGGDKVLSYYDYGKEKNPFLGMRSIRFSLQHTDIFVQQVRAIIRAGIGARVRVMFPMIASLDELRAARDIVVSCVDALKKEGVAGVTMPSLGVMIEVPSVLSIIDEIAQEVDFMSVGTNDLIQYLLAVDRTNEKVSDLYLPHHPAVLRALRTVAVAGTRYGCEVCVCGDMAHEIRYLPFLMGIGIRAVSVDGCFIGAIKSFIAGCSLGDAQRYAERLLSVASIVEVEEVLQL